MLFIVMPETEDFFVARSEPQTGSACSWDVFVVLIKFWIFGAYFN